MSQVDEVMDGDQRFGIYLLNPNGQLTAESVVEIELVVLQGGCQTYGAPDGGESLVESLSGFANVNGGSRRRGNEPLLLWAAGCIEVVLVLGKTTHEGIQ
jgi:hypothetical protein